MASSRSPSHPRSHASRQSYLASRPSALTSRHHARRLSPTDPILRSRSKNVSYIIGDWIGRGASGVVFQAECRETGEIVAIKQVLLDEPSETSELQIMKNLDHPNIVSLKDYFFSKADKKKHYLNLVLEYVPVKISYSMINTRMHLIYVKLYIYQICRALAYIHNIGICHGDIYSDNLLVNPHTLQLKLCDFGNAKVLDAYTTTAIDIWSTGCVMAELLLGRPLCPGPFRGVCGVDRLHEIIKDLGIPTSEEEITWMNPNYTEFKFRQVFQRRLPPEAIDLLCRFFQYSPNLRCTALEACIHPFFDELSDPNTFPNGPPLFNF